MKDKFKYEVSSDGFTWMEVANPCEFSNWKHDRTTHTQAMSELDLVKDQLKNANRDVDKLRKELAEIRAMYIHQSRRCGYNGCIMW